MLRAHNYDKNAAANALNIGLSSLYRKMDEMEIGKREEAAPKVGRSPEREGVPGPEVSKA